MLVKICLIALLCCSKIIAENELPSNIQHCRRNDPKILECVVKAEQDALNLFKNGYPERDIEPIEPIRADSIIIKGQPNKQFSLDQTYRNVEIHGFSNVIFKKVNGSIDECVFHQKLYIPRAEILSDYEMKGQLLLFHLNGFGKSNVTLYGVASQVKLTCEFFKENNNEYLRFKDLTFKIKAKEVYLDFDNIINGNKELSDVVGNILKENSQELFAAYSEPYAKIIAEQLLLRAKKFVKNIPVSKLYLPDL